MIMIQSQGKKRLIIKMFFIALIIMTFHAQAVFAEQTITMAFTISPSESVTFSFYNLVYTEAFKRLGYEFRYEIYPPARTSAMANSGEVDGEAMRTLAYNQIYTNLIPIEESVFSLTIEAFAVNPDIRIDSWESFRGSGYRVEYYRSAKLVEQKLNEVIEAENLSATSEHSLAFKKLITGRIDVYVDSTAALIPLLNSPEFRNSGIRPVGILMEVPMYSFLYKKHTDLAKELTGILRQMKDESLVKQFWQQASRSSEKNEDS